MEKNVTKKLVFSQGTQTTNKRTQDEWASNYTDEHGTQEYI